MAAPFAAGALAGASEVVGCGAVRFVSLGGHPKLDWIVYDRGKR
jgi:hypothetical protein